MSSDEEDNGQKLRDDQLKLREILQRIRKEILKGTRGLVSSRSASGWQRLTKDKFGKHPADRRDELEKL